MLLTVALVLFVLYVLGLVAFKITTGFIHLVLVLAVLAIIAHFVRGRAPAA